MKKYLAKLIFAVKDEQQIDKNEFDEQIRLIESMNLESAFFKARAI